MDISDAFMQQRMSQMRPYVLVLVKAGPDYEAPASRSPEQAALVREHARRNMRLQAEGIMPLVGPVAGGGALVGVCVFVVPEADARRLMDEDKGVQAGVFTYEVASWIVAPGDALPAA